MGRNVAFIEPVDEVLVVQPPKPNTTEPQNGSNSSNTTETAMEIDGNQVINSPRNGNTILSSFDSKLLNVINNLRIRDKSETRSKAISFEFTPIRKRSLWSNFSKLGCQLAWCYSNNFDLTFGHPFKVLGLTYPGESLWREDHPSQLQGKIRAGLLSNWVSIWVIFIRQILILIRTKLGWFSSYMEKFR